MSSASANDTQLLSTKLPISNIINNQLQQTQIWTYWVNTKFVSYWQMCPSSTQHRLYDYLWVCTDTSGIWMMICRCTYPDDCCCQARYLITICHTVWNISHLCGLLSRQLKLHQQGRMYNISQLMKHAAILNKAQQYGCPTKSKNFKSCQKKWVIWVNHAQVVFLYQALYFSRSIN